MLRDETSTGRQSGNPDAADLGVNGVDVGIDGAGEGLVERTPKSDIPVKDSAFEDSTGDPSSMFTISKVHGGSMGRRFSLRRSGSNIANLRAAFESKDTPETPFEKSPSRSISERLENISNRSREQDAEIARLEKQLAREIEVRQSCQNQLEDQLRRCKELEMEVEAGQANRPRPPSESKRTNGGSIAEVETQNIQRELKRSIAAATRIEHQISDSTFALEIANLQHELQNFIVNTFRRVKLAKMPEGMCESLEKTANPKQLELLRPTLAIFEPSMKLAVLQATAMCYIMDIFDEPLLFGLPNQQEWRENLLRTVRTLPAVLTPSTFNKWRYLTLDAVRQSGSIEEAVQIAACRVSDDICVTLSALTDVEDLAARATSLNTIVMRAVKLSHLFRVQRAQYEFALPVPGMPFNPDSMEDPTIDDGELLAERIVGCATFPSVIKHGDENGDNMHLSNVLIKAKVLSTVKHSAPPAVTRSATESASRS